MRKSLKKKLSNSLSLETLDEVFSSFDLIGDIAIIKAPSNSNAAVLVAKQIMVIHKGVNSVFLQTSPVHGDHRIRKLTLLAGKNKTVATYKEAGCLFAVDIEKCYFSPRLSYERLHIACQVLPNETVINMFAGVGCFSIITAKKIPNTKVYSIDINPTAYKFMKENILVNKVFGKVVPLLGDAKDVVETQLQSVADRVLMPLPEKALEYLPVAISALKKEGGWIHYYDFQHATTEEDPRKKTEKKVAEKLTSLGIHYTFAHGRVIRSTGPYWYQTALDIRVNGCPSNLNNTNSFR